MLRAAMFDTFMPGSAVHPTALHDRDKVVACWPTQGRLITSVDSSADMLEEERRFLDNPLYAQSPFAEAGFDLGKGKCQVMYLRTHARGNTVPKMHAGGGSAVEAPVVINALDSSDTESDEEAYEYEDVPEPETDDSNDESGDSDASDDDEGDDSALQTPSNKGRLVVTIPLSAKAKARHDAAQQRGKQQQHVPKGNGKGKAAADTGKGKAAAKPAAKLGGKRLRSHPDKEETTVEAVHDPGLEDVQEGEAGPSTQKRPRRKIQ